MKQQEKKGFLHHIVQIHKHDLNSKSIDVATARCVIRSRVDICLALFAARGRNAVLSYPLDMTVTLASGSQRKQ